MTITLTPKEAGERLAQFADEGRLIAGEWHAESDGRQLACALGAMHPKINASEDCPGNVMPPWLAAVIVVLFDGQDEAARVRWAVRFAGQLQHPRWSAVDWAAVRVEWLIWITTSALESARKVAGKEAYWPPVEDAHRKVVAALRGDGDLEAARADAAAAADAADAAGAACCAAADAAGAACCAATAAAGWAAAYATDAVVAADDADADAVVAGAAAARKAARSQQAARLCDLIDEQLGAAA